MAKSYIVKGGTYQNRASVVITQINTDADPTNSNDYTVDEINTIIAALQTRVDELETEISTWQGVLTGLSTDISNAIA